MDTMQAVILMAIFNIVFTGLVGGVVIYVIQKKIDATIQKSLFEHQIKFSTSHEKAIKTLEALHEQFSYYIRKCDTVISSENINRKGEVLDEYFKVWRYFKENRMFIPDSMEKEIENIITNSLELAGTAIGTIGIPERKAALVQYSKELNELTRNLEKLYKSVAEAK